MSNEELSPIKIINVSKYALFRTGFKKGMEQFEDIRIIAEAENGKQLLRLLEDFIPDIIVTDISLPEMDAFEALPIIKNKYPLIKIIILSMHNDRSMIIKMFELGANAYLTLDHGSEVIYEAIKKVMENGFYVINLLRQNPLTGQVNSTPAFNDKEIRILNLLCQNKSASEISQKLDLSPRTIEAILSKIKAKTNSKSVEELIEYCKKNNLIDY